MGGYLVGGGHGPNTRNIGLGSDNVIGVTMVLANGSIAQLKQDSTIITDVDGKESSSDDPDLFWAIRGGGGAFGVITEFTVKLHKANTGFTMFYANFKFNDEVEKNKVYAGDVMAFYFDKVLPNMDQGWSGYIIPSAGMRTPAGFTAGRVQFILLHNGKATTAEREQVMPLTTFRPELQTEATFTDFTDFWEYQKNVNDPTGFPVGIDSRLQQMEFLTNDFAQEMSKLMYDGATRGDDFAHISCTMVHVGGLASGNRNTTSVSDDMRDATLSSTCGGTWNEYGEENLLNFFKDEWNPMMSKYGRGVYYNEPGFELPNYADDFWGPKYDRLLEIKKKHDPNNVFNCNQCVGWEKVATGSGRQLYYTCSSLLLTALITAHFI
ncbi:PREDICTED: uncharacterized FAD-linked oxidoreductase ARB_02478-like [Priapulus caudatus]|uniref:Uncharacterized FAD-linked oxidoreductase ARB_02478-like n=1 Tax=Priapulus caudatus TaxID=37621 RepID=A0ABM1E700_PRICU|nr:PREDICTED: uncharacterized FAD-linked oxidoreductase ARB_02478-like [Priapulus caudatus]